MKSKENPVLQDLRENRAYWEPSDALYSLTDMFGDSPAWGMTPEQAAFAERVLTRWIAVFDAEPETETKGAGA